MSPYWAFLRSYEKTSTLSNGGFLHFMVLASGVSSELSLGLLNLVGKNLLWVLSELLRHYVLTHQLFDELSHRGEFLRCGRITNHGVQVDPLEIDAANRRTTRDNLFAKRLTNVFNIGRKTDVEAFKASCIRLSMVVFVRQTRQMFDKNPQPTLGSFTEEVFNDEHLVFVITPQRNAMFCGRYVSASLVSQAFLRNMKKRGIRNVELQVGKEWMIRISLYIKNTDLQMHDMIISIILIKVRRQVLFVWNISLRQWFHLSKALFSQEIIDAYPNSCMLCAKCRMQGTVKPIVGSGTDGQCSRIEGKHLVKNVNVTKIVHRLKLKSQYFASGANLRIQLLNL